MPAPRVLIVYHSVDGQTAKIVQRITSGLAALGTEVHAHEAAVAPPPDNFDSVVVGDAIHAVKHSRTILRYLEEHRAALRQQPLALFQVSLTSANPDEQHTATAQELVGRLLTRTGVAPDLVALFAGALRYSRYGWLKRRVMRAIVRREGGDTDMTKDYEYTDWEQVDSFAGKVAHLAAQTHEAHASERAQ